MGRRSSTETTRGEATLRDAVVMRPILRSLLDLDLDLDLAHHQSRIG
jgi:hypothetical protein